MIETPNFIEVYQNSFSDNFCDEIIEFIDYAEKIGITKNRQDFEKVSKVQKEDIALFIPNAEIDLKHSKQHLWDEFNKSLWDYAYKNYAKKYGILNTIDHHNSYISKIQKTLPGQGYHIWHCEAADRNSANRILTWTAYLNDNFEAGETEFLYQQYRYKPSKGDLIIFPAAFTHTHRGNPPINGDKYIITGWIEF